MIKPLFLSLLTLISLPIISRAEAEEAKAAPMDQLELKVLEVSTETDQRNIKMTTGEVIRNRQLQKVLEYELHNKSDQPAREVEVRILWVSTTKTSDIEYRQIIGNGKRTYTLAPGKVVKGTFQSGKINALTNQRGRSRGLAVKSKIDGYNIRLVYQGEEKIVAADPSRMVKIRPNPEMPTQILEE